MPVEESSIIIKPLASLKILLHAAKFPHSTVCGILLGPSSDQKTSLIDDAIPLFHHTTLSPLLETAFLVVEQYAKQAGKRLAGYYYASAQVNDPSIPPSQISHIASKINALYPGAVVIRVNNKKLAEPDETPLEGFVQDSQGGDGGGAAWSSSISLNVGQGGLEAFDRAGHEASQSLIDMDDHLDDASKDFLNPQVASMLR